MIEDLQMQRRLLMEQEHTLHDRLAGITSQLNAAKATVQICEIDLKNTIMELNQVRAQIDAISRKLESYWHQPGDTLISRRPSTG